MKVAVIGATGLVGQKMLAVLEERKFPVSELLPVASTKSVGKFVLFKGIEHKVLGIEDALKMKPDLALFSAGGQTSLMWAPKFAEQGVTVIDNSSAWRMHPDCPLVVPEVNASILNADHKIIANPNCSTIQMVVALAPLHAAYNIKRIVVSTYQSVTGTGKVAVEQLMCERKEKDVNSMAYPYRIDLNVLPHVDVFLDNGYSKEEMKMVQETQKIFDDSTIGVTATAVRIPVMGGHSEAINVEFKDEFDLNEVYRILGKATGIVVEDVLADLKYPMPLAAEGKDDVFVGRIRRDESQDKTLNLWVVSDNLRKGAATNAVQIAEYLLKHQLLSVTAV